MNDTVSFEAPTTDQGFAPSATAPAFAAAAEEKGNWFHRHRWFTKEPLTYTAYQMFRSTMAAIPYGFAMAGIHHLFGRLSHVGARMGLTEAGQNAFYQAFNRVDPVSHLRGGAAAGLRAVDVFNAADRALLHQPGMRGTIGRNISRFANSPINAALQIGLAFSLFRFTGGLIKTVRDKIMEEKNSAEDTKRETKNWWQTIKEAAKVNWKAEATGTFWAALTLGFIGALVQHTTPYMRLGGEGFGEAVRRVWDKPAKLLQNAAIWAVSYSAFFEVDERIQKDWKLREGTWKGHSNSLNNAPGNTVTGQPPEADGTKPERTRFAAFTQDPGLPRLIFRRLLPVAVGIGTYAAAKRVGYITGGGTMQPIGRDISEGGLRANIGRFLNNSWREGLATTTFGVLWMATDAWGSWYDKLFEKIQDKSAHKPVNDHQAQKLAELRERLNAKEMAQGRAA